ncbi:MAG: copper-transporting ATPase [Oligoflexia bacterium]|nr:MAG: copper-transporting ATPase [Oligoflexia bacterium]
MEVEYNLHVHGMSCASCVSKVEKALLSVKGVQSASVNLATEKARVTTNKPISPSELMQSIARIGYQADLIGDEKSEAGAWKKREALLAQEKLQVIFSAILSAPLVITMGLSFFDIHWMLPWWAQFALTFPVQFGFGARFYKGAWMALRTRSGNMDLLVSLGTTAAFFLSLYYVAISLLAENSEVKNNLHDHLYFESSAIIITLVLLGKYLENRAKFQTTEAIQALQALRPETARLIKNQTETIVPLEQISKGDQVVVLPGEKIPVDGVIIEGFSHLDESLLTGESLPVSKKIHDPVTAGSLNADGRLIIKTTAIGAETTLSRIIRLVESAQAAKAPIQRLVDQVSAIFVPIVILISLITITAWGILAENWEIGILNGVAVMVIACPCALGLATPTSIMVGTGAAAKAGILIKDAEALEITQSLTVIAFDKTGTLTQGHPSVTQFIPFNRPLSEVFNIATSLQIGSEHPLAKAFITSAQEQNLSITPADKIRALPGIGIQGFLNGQKYMIGSKLLLEERKINYEPLKNQIKTLEEQGQTISFIVADKNSEIIGLLSFSDQIKPLARQTIESLQHMNIKTMMITGDNWGSARHIANQLGLDQIQAEVLPIDKAQVIENLKKSGHRVGMVGDGLNDAPALASAHVGFAMATGTDVAMHTAGITLMRGNPLLVPDSISISKKTYQKIKQNLFWAFIYNIIGIPLAALGYLSPVIAGTAMAMSSFCVVTNALLLKRWQPQSRSQMDLS